MTSPAPGWYPDPGNPQLLRWWDGNTWTPHTQPNPHGQPGHAPGQPQQAPAHAQHGQPQYTGQPPQHAAAGFAPQQPSGLAPQQAAQANVPAGPAPQHPLYTAPELLIAQKATFVGLSGNAGAYQIFDPANNQIGTFKEERSVFRRAVKLVDELSVFGSRHFALTDAQDNTVLTVRLPQGFSSALKPKFEVRGPQEQTVGFVERKKIFARTGFVFTVDGAEVGKVEYDGRERGGARFACRDSTGRQVAEIVKRGVGMMKVKEIFTQDDSYILRRPNPIPEPLGSLVLISACALDQVFYERDR